MKIYYNCRLKQPKIVKNGTYRNFEWYIITLGTHPCSYILLPKDHKLYGVKDENSIDVKCHCGITYSRDYLLNIDTKGKWVIGYDYAHLGDYYSSDWAIFHKFNDHKYTIEELEVDIKNTIDDLVNRYG